MFGKHFHREPTNKQKIGELGENLACGYLSGLGYSIVERNYLKKWGEIDIIANRANKLHFVEVKTVSREISTNNVIHETHDAYRAEDNLHPWKLQRLGRAVQSFLLDRNIPENMDWQFDIVTVTIDPAHNTHKVIFI